jgi:hypothetical protein
VLKSIPFKLVGVLLKSADLIRRMRLVKVNNTSEFSLTKDLLVSDDIPRNAILSHTWGADTEEVSFKDMMVPARESLAMIRSGSAENKLDVMV